MSPSPAGWMAIRLTVLGSGSGGNATLIEGGGVRILLDAGFSCRRLVQRLRFVGCEPDTIDALLITHEHADHVAGAARFSLSFEAPIWCTRGTARAAGFERDGLDVRPVAAGQAFAIGDLAVRPFAVPHDAAETVGFVLEAGRSRLGYATDLGHGPDSVREQLAECDLLVLESNHDVDLVRGGPYPEALKTRILSRHGHLDNQSAADLLCAVAGGRTRTVVLAHLSETNNRPSLALEAAGRRLAAGGAAPRLHAAAQATPSPWFEA
ncbi:MAG TPA: MBL fold metallo-hydrolase [Patescibacteria group bacterium]|nr:MBL fold metallo-hydrolase [Patescibacteria group bacterium]